MSEMKWNNLKNYKCPSCSSNMTEVGESHKCTRCAFTLGKKKFNEILKDKLTMKKHKPTQAEQEENRQTELNNYKPRGIYGNF